RVSALAAQRDVDAVRRLVIRLLAGGILLATAGVAVGEMIIPAFIRWYFGAAFLPATPVFRTCLLGAIPYVVYILMRNILDAIDVKAVNSRNLIVSLIVLTVFCVIDSSLMWMSASLVGSLSLLGVLTLRDTYLRLRRESPLTREVTA
ncbi:MAG TPA: hypothetical protein VHM24_00380, partial [Gemmatimonadaceae bacterium]|nr:hypothetical protein [Gemmatimonadaceae bacterium]